jgi:hypothetical protein
MIGDRLYTISPWAKTSIITVLVLSGETKLMKAPLLPPDYVFQNLSEVADWLVKHP